MNCIICGKEILKSSFSNAVLCSPECFGINFWNEIVLEKDKHVFIDGCSYLIGNEKSKSSFRGFNGARFIVKMLSTGEKITTTNLWLQGRIPESHRSQLPDTAMFVRGE